MEKITNISQLKKGTKFVTRMWYGEPTLLEFLCVHPHDKNSIILLNGYTPVVKNLPWLYDMNVNPIYLFADTPEDWNEYQDMKIEHLSKKLESMKRFRTEEF